jgi:hypothetical protein
VLFPLRFPPESITHKHKKIHRPHTFLPRFSPSTHLRFPRKFSLPTHNFSISEAQQDFPPTFLHPVTLPSSLTLLSSFTFLSSQPSSELLHSSSSARTYTVVVHCAVSPTLFRFCTRVQPFEERPSFTLLSSWPSSDLLHSSSSARTYTVVVHCTISPPLVQFCTRLQGFEQSVAKMANPQVLPSAAFRAFGPKANDLRHRSELSRRRWYL